MGVFWGLTPLVGIQTFIVFVNWLLFRLVGLHFNLLVALSLIWISNPVTITPIYFGFYASGFFLLRHLNYSLTWIGFEQFRQALEYTYELEFWPALLYWFQYLYNTLLWPMVVGSLVIAIPTATASYFIIHHYVNKSRKRKAEARRAC